jgi:hypothetical protein
MRGIQAGTVNDALTDDVIAEAMRRAEQVICSPLDDRCFGLAFSADEALKERSP